MAKKQEYILISHNILKMYYNIYSYYQSTGKLLHIIQ